LIREKFNYAADIKTKRLKNSVIIDIEVISEKEIEEMMGEEDNTSKKIAQNEIEDNNPKWKKNYLQSGEE
jgi:hypothetical protein